MVGLDIFYIEWILLHFCKTFDVGKNKLHDAVIVGSVDELFIMEGVGQWPCDARIV